MTFGAAKNSFPELSRSPLCVEPYRDGGTLNGDDGRQEETRDRLIHVSGTRIQ